MLRLKLDLRAAAGWADNAFGPTAGLHVFTAVARVRKSHDSLLKGLGIGGHDLIVAETAGIVKYIFTKIFAIRSNTYKHCA